jgi:hypothetical protein
MSTVVSAAVATMPAFSALATDVEWLASPALDSPGGPETALLRALAGLGSDAENPPRLGIGQSSPALRLTGLPLSNAYTRIRNKYRSTV